MTLFRGAGTKAVSHRGAAAGSVLFGAGMNNQGLRLRVSQAQVRGSDGPIQGSFVIMDVGDNKHSESLAPLLNRMTNAAEVLKLIRERHPGCVSVTNANILVVEPTEVVGNSAN
jgi:hypothetical protein